MGTLETVTAALDYDGAEIEHDGRVWKLETVPDEHMSIFDEQGEGMWCGQLEWSSGTNVYGWPIRPDWADGGAEILDRDRGSVLWWRPLEDCLADRELRDRVRAEVLDCYRHGYCGVVVKTDDGHTASLWGIEPSPDDAYVATVAGELVSDILADIERDEIRRVRATFGLLDAIR